MKTSQAVKAVGGQKQMLARVLNISPAAVTKWGDVVPPLRAYQLREMFPDAFAPRPRKRNKGQPKE